MVLEYDGGNYMGWQIQPNGISIQEVVEKVLSKVLKIKMKVYASGRTDSGVHAEAQVAHFTTDSRMTELEMVRAFNSLLPHDISVKQVEDVSESFDARKSAIRKIYRYIILNRDYPSALMYRRVWFIPFPLDMSAIMEAKECLIGRHDFLAFQGRNAETKTSVREIYRIDISCKDDFIYMTFEGNGFLKHMVRNIVGTLAWIGKGKMPASRMKEILDLKNRRLAGPTAQPQGLCLVKVIYPDDCQ